MKEKISAAIDKLRENKNLSLYILIGLFIVIYSFFFTSKLWMTDGGRSEKQTALNTAISYGGRTIYVSSWLYQEDVGEMQVRLEAYNTAIDENDGYEFSAIDRRNRNLPVEVTLQDGPTIILRHTGIEKGFKAVSLRVRIKGSAADPLRLYTSENAVLRADTLEWHTSLAEYRKSDLNAEIERYTAEIESLKLQIADCKEKAASAEEQIGILEGRLLTATVSEKEKLESELASLYQNMRTLSDQINEYQRQIRVCENGIEEDRKTLEEIEK